VIESCPDVSVKETPDGYHLGVWDIRIVLGMIHRYGEACRGNEHARAGVLYSEIVRALEDQDDEIGPDSVPKDEAGAVPV
jgi:hypothetical protein